MFYYLEYSHVPRLRRRREEREYTEGGALNQHKVSWEGFIEEAVFKQGSED